jgi:lipopolysaccharide assembly outer membrane protein LptD (OstA)
LSARAEQTPVLQKKINNITLKITAPKAFIWKGKKVFADTSKQFGVEVDYGDLKVKANRAAYDLKKDVVELSDGFKGSFEQYRIEGEYFRINPHTGNYAGNDLKLGYMGAYFYGREFEFYGDRILVKDIAASPLQYPVFRIYTRELTINPAYSLARGNTLKFFFVPIYYIPL